MRPYLKRGIFVSTGFNTNVGISRVSFQRLGKPFSECRKNLTTLPTDSIYYKITNRGFQYTHDICKEVYTQINFYMAECGCMNPELLFTNKTNICQEPKSISCMINVTKSLNSLAINIKYACLFHAIYIKFVSNHILVPEIVHKNAMNLSMKQD